MIEIDSSLTPERLLPAIERMWECSGRGLQSLESTWSPDEGSPVFTVQGKYTSQGWTEWTQGFQFGSMLLQYDATDESRFLDLGIEHTLRSMPSHVSHIGVHDHGFNNVSTYGTLRRLLLTERMPFDRHLLNCCELALKVSGAVQAARWTETEPGQGYIYSFNGPHSLFADTIRSLRSLALAHQLGHCLMGEGDRPISLLSRLVQHAHTTARFNVYHGEGRDIYDVPGRVAHESIFNLNDGNYRCPSSQQGYSPFTTWTRGAAWIILGYAEELEFLDVVDPAEFDPIEGYQAAVSMMLRSATAAADYYLSESPTDGIPYWDTGAPGLVHLKDYRQRPADPFNEFEPVDSSAAAITAQGLLRLGRYLRKQGQAKGDRYFQAGLTILNALLSEPYLNTSAKHQGLLLHSVYHRPNGWDFIPEGRKVPCGESSMWGDYHLREAAWLVQRMAGEGTLPDRFFDPFPEN